MFADDRFLLDKINKHVFPVELAAPLSTDPEKNKEFQATALRKLEVSRVTVSGENRQSNTLPDVARASVKWKLSTIQYYLRFIWDAFVHESP